MKNECMHCGGQLRGRTDKKFCDDSCRSAYHNVKYGESTNIMRSTHRALRKNWKILNRHFRNGVCTIEYADIHKQGFVPDIITGLAVKEERVIYRCYEYIFEISDDGKIQLSKQENVNKTV